MPTRTVSAFDVKEGKPCPECGCEFHLILKGVSDICEECGAMIDEKPQRLRRFRIKKEE